MRPALYAVNREAGDLKLEQDFRQRVRERRKFDRWVTKAKTKSDDGKEIDRQDHLGYDLATVAHAPVAASNDGVTIMAQYFGIYGNTIVVDHGYGLLSLYGHLSTFNVKEDDPVHPVKRGQTIAQSGETGLAGGDHLHFSMILQGTQVDAREWWDPHWIHDRIQAKLEEFGQAGAAQRTNAEPAEARRGGRKSSPKP